MKKNELWTGRCENYTHDGMGVIKKDGFPYFVKGLLKGEKSADPHDQAEKDLWLWQSGGIAR